MSLQNSLLEALLRHAGFSHKYWKEDDRYIGRGSASEAVGNIYNVHVLMRYTDRRKKEAGKVIHEISPPSLPGEVLPAKEIPECCLEAALYCRRAQLEGEMTLAEKQYRVK